MPKTQERSCVNGLNPDTLVRIPTEAEFEGRDWMRSKELKKIGDALARNKRFGLLAIAQYEAEITYLWVNKQKKKGGRPVLGACFKESGRGGFYANCDYSIEVYAGSLRGLKFTHWQLQALITHELNHIDIEVDDETGAVTFGTKGHDAELFLSELVIYGPWATDLELAADAFKQAPLFGAATVQDDLQRSEEHGAVSLRDEPTTEADFHDTVRSHLVERGIPFQENASVGSLKRGRGRSLSISTNDLPRGDGLTVDPETGEILESESPTPILHAEYLASQGVTEDEQLPTVESVTATLTADERADVQARVAGSALSRASDPADVEATLKASGIPVRFDQASGLYRNPNGDAYPERWAEQEARSIKRSIGFATGT